MNVLLNVRFSLFYAGTIKVLKVHFAMHNFLNVLILINNNIYDNNSNHYNDDSNNNCNNK